MFSNGYKIVLLMIVDRIWSEWSQPRQSWSLLAIPLRRTCETSSMGQPPGARHGCILGLGWPPGCTAWLHIWERRTNRVSVYGLRVFIWREGLQKESRAGPEHSGPLHSAWMCSGQWTWCECSWKSCLIRNSLVHEVVKYRYVWWMLYRLVLV